ncbi:hypothetical protein Pint_08128 [Pistacia integerrima]|uniref:Uncharacterized protein n=1 Tax=Pistacia integerrima TaxID=434235 RepID=A0ACC0XYL2_9ROSI|nr:hypothetical protein Pint_08128 [Pistacia integerrima]
MIVKHSLAHQVLPLMLKNVSFDAKLAASTNLVHSPFTIQSVSDVFKSIPTLFFLSPRSIGRQKGFRHRAPLKQRNLTKEAYNIRNNVLVLGPAAYRDPQKVALGLNKALEFYYWVEKFMGLCHNEMTCREMAIVLARGNDTKGLWDFLKEMSRRGVGELVSTSTVTCLIKVLGEEGLVNEALTTFYRMKQFHCKPDVYAYNVVINALCRVGNFNKARFLLEQMELPGFRCAPDVYTYTILISSYWVGVPNRVTYDSFIRYYSAVNEIDRAVEMMRRMQKMNHGVPSSSSYTPIIHALCEAGRVLDARDFLAELVDGGSVPREYTYKLVCDALNAAGEANSLDDELHERIRDGIKNRCRQLMKNGRQVEEFQWLFWHSAEEWFFRVLAPLECFIL